MSGFGQPDRERLDRERAMYGVATGDGRDVLRAHDIDPPVETGAWSGPTGTLLWDARTNGATATGLVVESDVPLPDPEAACTVIEDAIEPIAEIDVDVDPLREHAAEIREEQGAFAAELSQPTRNESSMAESSYMYQ